MKNQICLTDDELLARLHKISVIKVISILSWIFTPILLFFILIYIFYFSFEGAMSYTFIFLITLGIIISILLLILSSKKEKLIRVNVIHDILTRNFELLNYDEYLQIDKNVLREVKLPIWDIYSFNNCFSANYNGVSFSCSNILLEESDKSKVTDHRIDKTIFEGQWIIIDLVEYYRLQTIKENSFEKIYVINNHAHILVEYEKLFQYNKKETIPEFKKKIQLEIDTIKGRIDVFLVKKDFLEKL